MDLAKKYITIFTPTYNRSHSLVALYESLLSQTSKDFEWIIVDDGSEDDTQNLVEKWINEKKIIITYYKQENGGKHRAINRGLKLAKGTFFFIADSDDKLTSDAIELVINAGKKIESDAKFAGVAFNDCYANGKRVGGEVTYDTLDIDNVSFREKLAIKGDMKEVWKTNILTQYPFPEFSNEKFISEGVVWSEIAKKYILRYINKSIYIVEYNSDGLSKNIARHHRNSPKGTMLYFLNRINDSRYSVKRHIIDAINYWRYTISYKGERNKFPLWMWMLYPVGLLFYYRDLK